MKNKYTIVDYLISDFKKLVSKMKLKHTTKRDGDFTVIEFIAPQNPDQLIEFENKWNVAKSKPAIFYN